MLIFNIFIQCLKLNEGTKVVLFPFHIKEMEMFKTRAWWKEGKKMSGGIGVLYPWKK